MLTDPAEFLPLMHGCLLVGLVAVPLYPPPLFGKAGPHHATTEAILNAARAHVLVVNDGQATPFAGVKTVVEVSRLPAGEALPPEAPEPDDAAFVQFTSGSTGTPRGVRVTHRALLANCRAIMLDGLGANERDRGVCWLPLYHDMGLIGFGLAPLLTKTPVTFIPTSRFVRNPAIWLRTLAETRATITFAPNFAYALATRRVEPSGLDLGSVRMWGCGAEPISEATLERFEQRFAGCGVRPGQISPCYGLAEATLAVTFTPPSSGRVVEHIDADAWEREGVARPARSGRRLTVVCCGAPLPDHIVTVVDPEGQQLPERTAGEIVVRGPSVSGGYFGQDESDAFRDGALHTGDQGYLAAGRLFVTGRLDDVVIVAGRNYAPQAIEAVAQSVAGVRLAAAFNGHGTDGEELWVAIERRGNDANIEEQVRVAVGAAIGVHVARVRVVAALPRTTSGKLRRRAARVLCESG
jgi:fatty-acyl-CoA synthase